MYILRENKKKREKKKTLRTFKLCMCVYLQREKFKKMTFIIYMYILEERILEFITK